MSKKAYKSKRGKSGSQYRQCVTPCPRSSRAGIHTVCAWSAWGRSTRSRLLREPAARIVSGFQYTCFAPGELSSRRELSLVLLTVLAPPPLRRSGGCTGGARNWIWQREWRRVDPYLYPHLSDPLPVLWVRKPVLRFLPLRGRDQCFTYHPPRRKMWRALVIRPLYPHNTRSY